MRVEAGRIAARRGQGFVLFVAPVPHVFGGYLHAAILGKGQYLFIHFGVLLGRQVIAGMDYANVAARLGRAFKRALHAVEYLRHMAGERRVRLVADYAVVQADLLELTGELQVVVLGQRMIVRQNLAGLPIVLDHIEHGEIPRVETGLGDQLNGLFLAHNTGDGANFSRYFHACSPRFHLILSAALLRICHHYSTFFAL